MNEMVKRVAMAIEASDQSTYGNIARAAIAAMREPTGEMMDKADFSLSERLGFRMVPEARRIWQLMIDEALTEE
jgi:hypothetical protein